MSVFSVYTDGRLTINYGLLSPKVISELMKKLHDRITAIAPFSRIPDDFTKWPSIPLAVAFAEEMHENEFRKAVEWLRGEIGR